MNSLKTFKNIAFFEKSGKRTFVKFVFHSICKKEFQSRNQFWQGIKHEHGTVGCYVKASVLDSFCGLNANRFEYDAHLQVLYSL